MNTNDTILICKAPIFSCKSDEDCFFTWLKNCRYLERFFIEDSKLHLEVMLLDLHYIDLEDLIALFYRYRLDMKLLKRFLNNENKAWFKDPKYYWHNYIFGSKILADDEESSDKSVDKEEVVVVCKGVSFFSNGDEASFFESLNKIRSIRKIQGVRDELHLIFNNKHLWEEELRDLIGLFRRYKISIQKLKVFMNETNKKWFD